MHIDLRIIHRTDPRTKTCPDCGKFGTLKRSRSRNAVEKFVKLLFPATIFRCKECGWRGYKSSYEFSKHAIKVIFIYVLLLAVTVFVVRFILLRFILK